MSKEEINVNNIHTVINIDTDTVITDWHFPEFPFVLDINILDNVSLVSKQILDLNNINGKINIYCNNKSSCLIHLGINLKKENNLEINGYLVGNENRCDVSLRVLQRDGYSSVLKTLGVIGKDTLQNEFLESIKVLSLRENGIICKPDLIVESNDAVANHNVTIRSFNLEELFYFESKGISREVGKKLIMDGFIKSMLS